MLKNIQSGLPKKKALLFVDNVSSHRATSLQCEGIIEKFLPPNTTSIVQPIDQGVIVSFK